MRSLLKEPFVQFVVLGTLLFFGHGLWERHVAKSEYTINVDTAEMERQAAIFATENRRQPTDEDLQALLFAHVEEEVLVREALKLGLGDNDTIIRRRLAQKMRFLIEDTRNMERPDESDLRTWFDANKDQFIVPEMRGFSHIYLSPEKHGDQIDDVATSLLKQVSNDNWNTLGDPFMLNRSYEPIDQIALERLMGASFAKSVFDLIGEDWQGPIESAFGLHIVKLNAVKPEIQPSFEDARAKVEAVWSETTRRSANNKRLRELIDKYDIEVDE
ncbi:MAG: peptidyl-prolyl cis-trans isomerase [Hyphomonadaceae bacterium]|nr:peptidyl-prolyl cis-trans isomerase [Hyphomonadaceae bacterium]